MCTYIAKNLEFLNTFVHIHTRTSGDHARIQDYNDGIHCECTTNCGFTHVSFVQNVTYVRSFSSRAREICKSGKLLLKLQLTIEENLHLAIRKITHYTVHMAISQVAFYTNQKRSNFL